MRKCLLDHVTFKKVPVIISDRSSNQRYRKGDDGGAIVVSEFVEDAELETDAENLLNLRYSYIAVSISFTASTRSQELKLCGASVLGSHCGWSKEDSDSQSESNCGDCNHWSVDPWSWIGSR
jgi:hypothetical protein